MAKQDILITVPIIPKAQARDRIGLMPKRKGVKDSGGMKDFRAMSYKAKEQKREERTLMTFLAQHRPPEPIEGPILISFVAFLPIPKSKPKKWKTAALAGDIKPCNARTDIDNIAKHLLDCMTSMRFYEDDRQIVRLEAEKRYSNNPRWEITLCKV